MHKSKMMYKPTPEQYIWDVNMIRETYPPEMNLSFEQLEQMYKFDQFKMTPIPLGKGVWFNDFEERDHELMIFRSFLSDEQYTIYSNLQLSHQKRYENSLHERDIASLKEIEALEAQIKFYRENIVGPLFSRSAAGLTMAFSQRKLEFLKGEYRAWLAEARVQLTVRHFKEYRNYCPNKLKESLLRHQLDSIFPNYESFSSHLDSSTLLLTDELFEEALRSSELNKFEVEHTRSQLKEFLQKENERILSKPAITVNFGGTYDERRADKAFLLSLVLIDKSEYDWKSNDYLY